MPNFYEVVNTIRANQSKEYQDRIPVASDATFKDIGIMLTSQDYEAEKESFLNAFVYKVCFKDAINRLWRNPLAVLKRGTRPYGGVKEIAHTNPVKGKKFDSNNVSGLLANAKPDVKTAYFKRNRQDLYEVTITDAELRVAFTSQAEFGKLYESVINAMYSGDNMDEYLLMREAISTAIKEGRIKTIEIDYASNPSDLIKLINTLSRFFKYEKSDYAPYNKINAEAIEAGTLTPVLTWCPPERQVLLIREDVDVNTDIDVLAKAMQMSKTDFAPRKIGIDTFNDEDTLCLLCDQSFFEFEDEDYKVKKFENGYTLTMKYILHHWETIMLNAMANAVAIKQSPAAEAVEE